MLILQDRFMAAAFAKTLNCAGEAVGKDAAVAATATAAATKDQVVDEGQDIPALAVAARYGDWPHSLWPRRFMLSTFETATRGVKGSPVP